VVGQLYLRRHGVEINNKNTVRSFVKFVAKRKKRKNGFNPRSKLWSDFLEMQENNHWITNAASAVLYWFDPRSDMKMTFETDQNALLTYVIATISS
jgi:hypothetical protein